MLGTKSQGVVNIDTNVFFIFMETYMIITAQEEAMSKSNGPQFAIAQ